METIKAVAYLFNTLGFVSYWTSLIISFGDIKSIILFAAGLIYLAQKIYREHLESAKKKIELDNFKREYKEANDKRNAEREGRVINIKKD